MFNVKKQGGPKRFFLRCRYEKQERFKMKNNHGKYKTKKFL